MPKNECPPARIAVVIPCYKVTRHVAKVIAQMPAEVWRIYAVDDACPDRSGRFIEERVQDNRVRVLYHGKNLGVGGAVITGYCEALKDGAEVIVKVDGDGQMDPLLVPAFAEPILAGEADYTKGNRFYDLEQVQAMPAVRIFGNAVLSLVTKMSSGYWQIFDPTNGYTAIHAEVARLLPLAKISNRYFFETDMLFRLNTFNAVVLDVPMDARYGDEVSNLRISKIVGEFIAKHVRNTFKRIFYNYYLRGLSLASIELPIGVLLLLFGIVYGGIHWWSSARQAVETPVGTVMVTALSMLVGLQLLLAFLGYDIAAVPNRPIHRRIARPHAYSEEPR